MVLRYISVLFFILALGFLNAQELNLEQYSCASSKSQKKYKRNKILNEVEAKEGDKYDVNYYLIDLSMTNTSTYLDGKVEMHGKAKEDLDSLIIELFSSFTISELTLNNTPVAYRRTSAYIKLPANLLQNEKFVVSVTYNGTPPDAASNPLGGSGMTNASSPSWGNKVTWSLSDPYYAYEWFPCKQSLTDKIDSVDVRVTVPSTCKAGSNGVLEKVEDLGNGKSKYYWKHRYLIDYYLISVSVAEYVDYSFKTKLDGYEDSLLVQNFIYNNPKTLETFKNDVDETANFLKFFHEIYGPYPFIKEKYGHCMAPISGGMEHQTMTTQGFFEKKLTAHELAHQWFGNHVTNKYWKDIWVNEGFATYSAYLMLERYYPAESAGYMNTLHTSVLGSVNGSIYVDDTLNSARIFSQRLTYYKGAGFIHTLRYLINNDSLFLLGLRNFQAKYAYGNATGLDVMNTLESTANVDLSKAFEEWYFGEGYPTYSVKWNVNQNDLILKISHTTSTSITPTYTNPIDIQFSRTGMSDTIIRFPIQTNSEFVQISGLGNVSNVKAIDPNNWIMNSAGSIVKDTNLLSVNSIDAADSDNIKIITTNEKIDVSILDNQPMKMFIYDINGSLILQKEFSSNYSVNTQNYAKGTYLVNFETSKGEKITRKVVRF